MGLFSLLGKWAVPLFTDSNELENRSIDECRWASFLAPASSSANQIGNSAVPFNANNAVKLPKLMLIRLRQQEEMLYIVEHVVLNGKMLMASPEYQQLTEKGFYVTSITWVAQQNHGPHNRIEFEAGFEHPKQGKAFRYNVRGLYRKRKGKAIQKL